MSVLSAREQMLFDAAKKALPAWLFEDESVQEMIAGFAKQFAPVWDAAELRVQSTFIGTASTEALNQHAKDRGTRRQGSETDPALTARLRYQDDAVTPAAIKTVARNGLEADGVTIPAGYPGLVELRRDRAFFQEDAGTGRKLAYFSRGYRMAGTTREATKIIVILPFGTSAATAQSIAEALRQKKAGGVAVIVERRQSP
jgi:hypothetical protein